MIYPPAPDIWLCEVLFRQSRGASALRGGGRRGDLVVERSGPALTRRPDEPGCRCGMPSISTPLRCAF
jgi:hypothetical protein